ncbi:uncharacterized protein Dwil_GK19185 [Drosophila willistoni]|uniref:Uncharacterized protein n=1 Tax=Drosophila willistoni TaxID=7260 RepID=B4NAV0_DROWI|nr:uncharacterized protein LOC6648109 [Drosophila willistoni]EDW80914.1 uncharacterized protein Dwil_GK19185 [Drosophila willistoni]
MAPKKKIRDLKKLYEERWQYPPAIKAKKIKYTACGELARYGIKEPYEPCWKFPLATSTNVRFGPCWEYPPERYKRRPLPPPCRGSRAPPELLEPCFTKCETLYTRFDFQLEQCVHEQILVIQQKYSNLELQLTEAKAFQIEKAEQMRYQAIRYQLLTSSACCTKIYPEYLSKMAEERALCEFQKAYDAINQSNNELGSSVLDIDNSMPELEKRLKKIDRSLRSPFLMELHTVLETIENLSNYFFGVTRKLKIWAQLMQPTNEHSIEDYLALLKMNQDFSSLMRAGSEKCTCKRCDNKNPLLPYVPCWSQPSIVDDSIKKRPIKDFLCSLPIAFRPKAFEESSSSSKLQDISVSSTKP